MTARRGLDAYCGAGGVDRGLTDAGLRVVAGVDLNPRVGADYLKSGAEKFWCGDALECLAALADRIRAGQPSPFDFICASPPCQHYSGMSTCRPGLAEQYPDLIGATRELLNETRLPWVLENVSKARPWMKDPVMLLCGIMFGRPCYRERLFELGGGLVTPEPPQPPADIRPLAGAAYALLQCPEPPRWQDKRGPCGWPHPIAAPEAAHWKPGHFASPSGNEFKLPSERSLGIDWMRERADRGEAIPPAMAQWIAEQVAAQLEQTGVTP